MSRDTIHVAVIVGSTREGRQGRTVADWFTRHLRTRNEFAVDVVDLAELALPRVHPQHPGADVQAYRERIDRADAFVVVTPEYNHSYPASLKHAIDLAHDEWRRKPVAFVSYGGISGGLRAVEHLRGVFAELHAVTVRETVSFHWPWSSFGPDGLPADEERSAAAVTTMLDDLTWWARALRDARSRTVEAAAW